MYQQCLLLFPCLGTGEAGSRDSRGGVPQSDLPHHQPWASVRAHCLGDHSGYHTCYCKPGLTRGMQWGVWGSAPCTGSR